MGFVTGSFPGCRSCPTGLTISLFSLKPLSLHCFLAPRIWATCCCQSASSWRTNCSRTGPRHRVQPSMHALLLGYARVVSSHFSHFAQASTDIRCLLQIRPPQCGEGAGARFRGDRLVLRAWQALKKRASPNWVGHGGPVPGSPPPQGPSVKS